jgi:hypothetical protein
VGRVFDAFFSQPGRQSGMTQRAIVHASDEARSKGAA